MRSPVTLRTGFWLARAAAFVLVLVLTLTSTSSARHRGFEVAVVAGIGVLLTAWGLLDWLCGRRNPAPAAWVLPVILGCLGTLGGLGSALGPANWPVAFAFVAVVAGGSEVPIGAACAVTAASVLGIEISGIIFGFSTATALGLPLLLLAGLLAGRNRREARMRADQAGMLVIQMRLAQEERQRAAALNEHNRIAREIHDVLAHSISALGVQIQAAYSVLGDAGDVEGTLRLLDGAQRLAEDGLTDSRRAILALRDDAAPLPESVAALVDNYTGQHDDPIDFVIAGNARPLQPDANLALVRITHEALTNAAKHAPGGAIRISLNYDQRQTTLTIVNTPAPLDPARSAEAGAVSGVSGGYGLAGMRERLLLIGGTLTAGPRDTGWAVQAKVPQ